MDILDGRDVIVDFDDIYGRPGKILRSIDANPVIWVSRYLR